MALIDRLGEVIADDWSYLGAEETALAPNTVVPLNLFSVATQGAETTRPIGVLVTSDTPPERLVALLENVDLVVVEFPKFRDGRSFTIARTLRERYGFRGDIRALGHVLPDQFGALVHCGFSTVVTPAEHPREQWRPSPAARSASGAGGQLLHRLVLRGSHKGS
jgi:uncharacterized protein (DUF934 family)